MSRYLTTTLPYVNADPHIGNALEFVQADALARSWRLMGEEVFFNMGTDEHGQKILQAAEKAGKDVSEYVNHYSGEFRRLGEVLDLSYDAFIRTTDPVHIAAAQEMWRRCEAAGDIYKKTYTGLYCTGCEFFKTEADLIDGKCPLHPSLILETISEENYFFRLSRYGKQLLDYLSSGNVITPGWRREEAVAFVKGGLEDFSISREKVRLSWGIPVPGDDSQVMFVWFDALTSYLSTLGWPEDQDGKFKKFWEEGATLQMAGKDQVRFQSLMWQAMLMSANIKNTDQVFYHGFINSGGHRMSKSLGNVISPYELTDKYGTDATRYLLLRHVHPFEDSDVTWERLDEWYTANLVNGLGNLVARIQQMSSKFLDQPVAETPTESTYENVIHERLNAFEFGRAIDAIWSWIQDLDGLIQEQKPFEVIKTDKEAAVKQVTYLVTNLRRIGKLLEPFMPATSKIILESIKVNKKPENLFPRLP